MNSPTDEEVTLADCPEGLFLFAGNNLGFKSEYMTENSRGFYQTDAYVVDSGEYFWGGATTSEDREKVLVCPISAAALTAFLSARGEQEPTWQPIETAPTNRAILIHVPNTDYYGNDGVWEGMLVDMGTGRRWMTCGWAMGRNLGPENAPDMWMPLPPAPKGGCVVTDLVERREWLIRKDGYFYRPNRCGYTTAKHEAGRYTEAEARKEAEVEPWHMSAIHETEFPDDPTSARIAELEAKVFTAKAEAEKMQEATIEECARVVAHHLPHWSVAGSAIIAAIRALKEVKP